MSLTGADSGYKPPFELGLVPVLSRSASLKRSAEDHRIEALQPTGIPILDKVTGGGFPRPSAIALMGPIGSGKSSLVRELVTNFIRQGCSLLYYCIDDPADIVKLGLEDHHKIGRASCRERG